MPFQMVNTERRSTQGSRDRTSYSRADEQRACQPGPARVGNDIDLLESCPCLDEHLPKQRQDAPDVVSRGQLRNDSAIDGVEVDLAVEALAEQSRYVAALRTNKSDSGLVARRFDSDDIHREV